MKIRFKHQQYQTDAVAVDCFDDEIEEGFLKSIKINTEQILKQLAPATEVRVI